MSKKLPIQRNGLCGEHIDFAIKESIELAEKTNRRVGLSFNGFKVLVSKRMSAKHLENQYSHYCKSQSIRFRSRRSASVISDNPKPNFEAFYALGRKLAKDREELILKTFTER